jgi:hypothetical protein
MGVTQIKSGCSKKLVEAAAFSSPNADDWNNPNCLKQPKPQNVCSFFSALNASLPSNQDVIKGIPGVALFHGVQGLLQERLGIRRVVDAHTLVIFDNLEIPHCLCDSFWILGGCLRGSDP